MTGRDAPAWTRRSPRGPDTDDRAVSEVLGAVLLFGLLLTMIVAFQVTAVPVFNQQVEYEHNKRVQGQLDLLRTNLVVTTTTGRGTSSHVTLGTDYPGRPFLVNPPPASGTLRTGPPGAVEVRNAVATGEVGDYWTGAAQTFTTRSITYTSHYNEYGNAPVTRIENGLVYNQFDGAQRTLSDENLVDGRRISLLLVNGSLAESGTASRSIDVEPTSAPTRTVTVRDGSAPITVTVPTRLSEASWRDLLADELVTQGGHVTSISYLDGTPYNRLSLELEPGVTYELTLAKAGVGSRIDRPGPHYLTTVGTESSHLPPGQSTLVTVEVRDRYDNPVSGTTVDASVVSGSGSVTPVDPVTGTVGRATFRYTAPASETTATVETRISATPSPREAATATVDVFDPSRTDDFLDMGQRSNVVFASVTSPTGNNNNKAEIDFTNRGSTAKEIVAARFVSYYDSAPSTPAPAGLVLGSSGTTLENGGVTTTVAAPITIPAGATERIVFDFRDAAGDPSGSISKADFVVVTFRFADGTESMYLVQLTTK